MADAGVSDNILLLADSYKSSHHLQYPPGTTTIYSYFESRGGKFPSTLFFGLQYILKRYFEGPVVTPEKIREADEFFKIHMRRPDVFNRDGWNYIAETHEGRLPIRIKAVPEGSVVPTGNVLLTVENTDPKVPWLTNYLETLLVQVWYPTTVATNSWFQKVLISKYRHKTSDNFQGIDLQLHDFGFRGSTSVESASLGGAAHLVNFTSSDTIPGVRLLTKYYNCDISGFSTVASEHSTITSWGRQRELDACRNMLERFPTGVVACVSDSYNLWNCCEQIWGKELREAVIKRSETGSVLVVRPDSGDPKEIVVKVLEVLGEAFGTRTNTKGYRMLPPYIQVIQGDGISYETLGDVLENMKSHKWSAANVYFGSGGALLQKLDRDTQKCAYKCSWAFINGEEVNVFKDPITDPGKKSKKGRLSLERTNGIYKTVEGGKGDPTKDLLVTVFENGHVTKEYNLKEIRQNADHERIMWAGDAA